MPMPKLSYPLGCLVLVSAVVLTGCATDHVTVSGGDGAEDGILVDGTASGTPHVYDRYTGPDGSAITVGPYDAGPGEVIAYTRGHAPTLDTPVTWTPGSDSITFAYDPTFRVKFKIWVVKGPFADGQTKAIATAPPSRPRQQIRRAPRCRSAFGRMAPPGHPTSR